MKLAINGGTPVRDNYLTYGRQSIDDSDIESVIKVLKGDFITTGPKAQEFERKVAEYIGVRYAVSIANGTAALHMACAVAEISAGDEVLIPAITFAASANCVLYCGGTPVFVDVNPKTYNIDIEDMKRKITSKTKVIIPVDMTGQGVDIDRIMEVAKKHNLIVIEDAAHALGSEYKGRKVGATAHITEFSFHPVKPITTGEGGMVVTNDKDLYEKMLRFRSHGITRKPEFLVDNHGPWYYEQLELGFNYRITDLQCALGISQMDKLDKFICRRREIVNIYNEAFKELKEITSPFEAEFSNSGWHIYVIALNLDKLTVGRKEIFEALQKENIGVNVHYMPVYLHPYYKNLGYEKGLCPAAEDLYNRIITIPLFPSMTDKDIEDVIKAVKKVTDFYRK
ncbi:UDP-4-amino-4,6-dideoxy-N-acetyl-beta-L-altrosamine transaminase [Clostridium sp.]|uniref:UDP-4-amino-4, 6-dideoxy-N-acetyl-beta-L-altrosamine transaminase n=1 Tax=Clostridium sp. TaxID=1506 RepID=UPI003216C03D